MAVSVCVFDAYGTLFDVNAAAREAAREDATLAECWPRLAADWRAKQLQYTWIRALAGVHADFWQVTTEALDWAMEASGLEDRDLRERLLALYRELAAYPEVPAMLAALKQAGMATAILSNGSPGMLEGAVKSAGIGDFLDDVLSVEAVGIFKPAPAVYALVTQAFSCTPEAVLFVSSNGWDAAAAKGFGFRSAWANRAGEPADRLPWKPDRILPDLRAVPELAAEA